MDVNTDMLWLSDMKVAVVGCWWLLAVTNQDFHHVVGALKKMASLCAATPRCAQSTVSPTRSPGVLMDAADDVVVQQLPFVVVQVWVWLVVLKQSVFPDLVQRVVLQQAAILKNSHQEVLKSTEHMLTTLTRAPRFQSNRKRRDCKCATHTHTPVSELLMLENGSIGSWVVLTELT